jgi:hypothetical protein
MGLRPIEIDTVACLKDVFFRLIVYPQRSFNQVDELRTGMEIRVEAEPRYATRPLAVQNASLRD